ncbi:MAG: aminopeptidase P family protein [Alphaproteobacteria bacterium]|nr:aminopeptidase P family protein [Alphaproteobacteria bacterium]
MAASPLKLCNVERAKAIMAEHKLDAIVGAEDPNLYYLSDHAPDSVLAHFYDNWAAAILPRHADAPGCLVTSEYDTAYLATHPSWLPELRLYGADWSSAAGLLKKISEGVGVDTELRAPLNQLYQATRAKRAPSLVAGLAAYIGEYLPTSARRVAFDDLRFGAAVRDQLGGALEVVDGRWPLRQIRMVKTPAEIALLRRASDINEAALAAAIAAVRAGGRWLDMVQAYRHGLAQAGAKPAGERGMLFGAGPDGSFVLDHDYVANKVFAVGEAVVLDGIATYRLYHADMARTAIVGAPSNRQRMIFGAVGTALEEAEARLKPGVHTRELEQGAAAALTKHGLEPRLATLVFHPIGLNVFDYGGAEAVAGGWRIEANNMLNFEIFYRDPEAGGIHLEDSRLITATGSEKITRMGRELIVTG